jgi:hypothetical protein
MNLELPHLGRLEQITPRTASGRVAAVWAVIRASLAAGKKPREVYEAAERDGLEVPYAQFRVYVHRLRKRDLRRELPSVSSYSPAPIATQPLQPQRNALARDVRSSQGPSDPLRNVREQRAKKTSFDYNPFPPKGLTR